MAKMRHGSLDVERADRADRGELDRSVAVTTSARSRFRGGLCCWGDAVSGVDD